MNLLLNKYQDYMRLNGCRASYELADGTVIMVPYLEENFLHLIGLHKLTDIQLIQFWRDPGNPSGNKCRTYEPTKDNRNK